MLLFKGQVEVKIVLLASILGASLPEQEFPNPLFSKTQPPSWHKFFSQKLQQQFADFFSFVFSSLMLCSVSFLFPIVFQIFTSIQGNQAE